VLFEEFRETEEDLIAIFCVMASSIMAARGAKP